MKPKSKCCNRSWREVSRILYDFINAVSSGYEIKLNVKDKMHLHAHVYRYTYAGAHV